ncbi:MAG: glycosyltransferase family 2 protein [Patescibacteria group bacterium]
MKKLSVIIPVYNEKNTIEEIIRRVESVNIADVEKEIILIDDCSDDGTREILRRYENRYKLILLDRNRGKGNALKIGLMEATGDLVIIQDADLEYSPDDYPRLIKPVLGGDADFVYGSRFLRSHLTINNRIVYKRGYLFSQFLNLFSNVLSGLRLSDVYTCYKVFSKEAAEKIGPHLVSERFGVEIEIAAYSAKSGLKIIEVPISYKGRTYEEGKKINWKDGLAAIWHIVRFNIFTKI